MNKTTTTEARATAKAKGLAKVQEFQSKGTIQNANQIPTEVHRKPERKKKTTTTRAQKIAEWSHWKATKPALDQTFPAPAIVLTPEGFADLERSNQDAIKVLEVLMKGAQEMLQNRLNPTEAPRLAPQAWNGYAKAFNLEYRDHGDQQAIPHLRLLFRRLCAKQTRVRTAEILPKMAGFIFRMDTLRRNGKQAYYPNRGWADIYSHDSKHGTSWIDAISTDPTIQDPVSYMATVEPFERAMALDGSEVQLELPSAALRLQAIRERVSEAFARCKAASDSMLLLGTWDKKSEAEKLHQVLGDEGLAELRELEKEVESDPADEVVP